MHCRNLECGHTFVCHLEAVRTISPSAQPHPGVFLPVTGLQKIKAQISLNKTDGAAYCQADEDAAKVSNPSKAAAQKRYQLPLPPPDPILQALHSPAANPV